MPRDMDFEEFLEEVDAEIADILSPVPFINSRSDLPDWDWWRDYEAGVTPRQCAINAISNTPLGTEALEDLGVEV